MVEWNVPKSTPMRVRPLKEASPDRGVGVLVGVGVDVLTGVVVEVGVDALIGVGVDVGESDEDRVRTVTDCSMTVPPD